MDKEIDCRGLACPAPVLQTKQAMEKDHPEVIEVVVDNEASKQNVSRFMESQNLEVTVMQEGKDFHAIGKRQGGILHEEPVERPESEQKKIMVMVANDRMGHGDDELGEKLMVSFLKTLKEMGEELWRLVFVNNGVKFTIDGSDSLSVIQELVERFLNIPAINTVIASEAKQSLTYL